MRVRIELILVDPETKVASGWSAGAEITTRVAPAPRCSAALSRFVYLPVRFGNDIDPELSQGSAFASRLRRAW